MGILIGILVVCWIISKIKGPGAIYNKPQRRWAILSNENMGFLVKREASPDMNSNMVWFQESAPECRMMYPMMWPDGEECQEVLEGLSLQKHASVVEIEIPAGSKLPW